jgi:hypothetical protein
LERKLASVFNTIGAGSVFYYQLHSKEKWAKSLSVRDNFTYSAVSLGIVVQSECSVTPSNGSIAQIRDQSITKGNLKKRKW